MLGTKVVSRKVIGDWLKSEETNGSRYSRDNIVIAKGSGQLITGTVLGLLAVGAALASLEVDNTGNGTIAAGAVGAGAQIGTYRIVFTSDTAFNVTDPSGDAVGSGTVGTAFNTGGVAFTITAGTTAFAAGDEGAITIDPGSGKYVPFNPAGTGGAEVAKGILVEDVDATDANKDVAGAAVVRHAHIAPSGLTFKVAATDAQQAAALASLRSQGILTVREA